jgi:ATP-dependent Clp protease ATP-binding subunit ClpA
MLSKTLEMALIRAIREAKTYNHEYVTIEHMLYGLLHDELTTYIIEECGGSIDNLKNRLEDFFLGGIPKLSSKKANESTSPMNPLMPLYNSLLILNTSR